MNEKAFQLSESYDIHLLIVTSCKTLKLRQPQLNSN